MAAFNNMRNLWATHRLMSNVFRAVRCNNFSSVMVRRDQGIVQPLFSRLDEKLEGHQVDTGLGHLRNVRHYGAERPLNRQVVKERVLLVLNLYDKINNDKLTLESHFIKDLGLDSLDHVEVIMAIEDEFGFEIPDDHGEKLLTPAKLIDYVCDHEETYEDA